VRAQSVEGIWQGLKLIEGRIDESMFSRAPKKRKGNIQGHKFGNNVLDYQKARQEIYVPSYVYHVVHRALPETAATIEKLVQPVKFHDVEKNGDINDTSSAFAHSALLAQLLNVLWDAPIAPFNKQCFSSLADRSSLPQRERQLFDEIITFAYLFSPSTLEQTFALRYVKFNNMETPRLDRYIPCAETHEPYRACSTRLICKF